MSRSKATMGRLPRILTTTFAGLAISFGTVASVPAQTVADSSTPRPAPATPAARKAATPPTLLHRERAIHELRAGLRGLLGGLEVRTRTELQLLVDDDGRVIRSEVSKSSGYRMIDATLRRNATSLRFRPAVVDGHAASAFVILPIDVGAPGEP